MAKIALLSNDVDSRGIYLGHRKLPDNYMGDFSLLGFVVDCYPEALTLLAAAGYQLEEQEGGADISVDKPQRLLDINAFLTAHNIRCDISDVADTLYQA